MYSFVIYLWNMYFYIISFTSHQLFREDSLLWHQKQRLVLAVGVHVCQSTCRSLWGKNHLLYSKYNTHWLIENTSFQNWTPTSMKEGELEAEREEDTGHARTIISNVISNGHLCPKPWADYEGNCAVNKLCEHCHYQTHLGKSTAEPRSHIWEEQCPGERT